MSNETAFLINNILHDVLRNTKYDLTNTYLSSKTGQSNYDYNTRMKYNIPANATKDSWVIGYTPDLLVAVWCGYEDIKKGLYLTPKTKDIPLNIVKMILDEFAPDSNGYKVPNNLKRMNVEVINGLIYHANNNKNSVSDYFFKGYTPLNRDNLDLDIV
jgi:penicillin-binding protein 1A